MSFTKVGSIDQHKNIKYNAKDGNQLKIVDLSVFQNENGFMLVIIESEGLLSIWQIKNS